MPDDTLPPSPSAQQATNVLEVLKGLIPDYLQQDMKPTTMVPNAAGKIPQLEPYSPLEQAAYGAADLAGLAGPALAPKLAAGALGIGARGLGRLAPDLTAGAKLPSEWMAAYNALKAESGPEKAAAFIKNNPPPGGSRPLFAEVPGSPDFTDVIHSGSHEPFAAIVKSNASNNYLLHHAGTTSVFDTLDKAKAHAKELFNTDLKTQEAVAAFNAPKQASKGQSWEDIVANHDAKMQAEEYGASAMPMKPPNNYWGSQWDLSSVPREAQWQIPEKGKQLGFNVPTHHATRVPTDFNKFMLPETEIGVHFGSPKAALDRIGGHVDVGAARTYPVGIQANNPLELPDLGSWGPNKMVSALRYKDIISPMEAGKILRADYDKRMPMIREAIRKAGHDSISYKNSVEDPGSTSYILFNESKKQPGYVTGARAPWAAYHPEALDDPNILRGLAGVGVGGTAAANPDIQNLIRSLGK